MEETKYCYIGRQPGCRCIGVVVVDNPEHAKDTASTVSQALRNGLEIERMEVEVFRALKDKFGCARDMRMRECKKRGLNKVAA
jgi:hypothetical protein